jgi:hypothetical protein
MIRKHMTLTMCAAAIGILCCGGGALAQTIYKHMDATGHTTYTDGPAADGIVVPYATSPSQERGAAPPRIVSSTRSDLAQALFSSAAMSSMHAATIDFNEATRRLTQARESRQQGIESQLREAADSAITSPMNIRYQRHQQRLEREVVAAELRLHETSLVRSALSRSDNKPDPLERARR